MLLSQIVFRSYEQGMSKLMGASGDFIHCDECPPEDITSSCWHARRLQTAHRRRHIAAARLADSEVVQTALLAVLSVSKHRH